jgi:hypothetical protein
MIRAILRAQWLSMRLSRLASGRRRAVFTGAIAVLWYGFWTFLAAVAEELRRLRSCARKFKPGCPSA